jgi:uncharacterized protein (DUF952 family)
MMPTDTTSKETYVFHFCRQKDWKNALRIGLYPGSELDQRDGFIHLSTAVQVRETAALHLTGMQDLVLLQIEAASLGDALKWEPSRGGALFPHLYRALSVDLVIAAYPLELDEAGQHVFPELDK